MASSPDRFLDGETLMAMVQELTASGQSVRWLPFQGVSMLPMLRQGRDRVELSPLPDQLKKGDLPVYRLKSCKYVMHRVIQVHEDHYTCLGDNLTRCETVYPEQLVALVTAFTRDDRVISASASGYQLYAHAWVALAPLRLLWGRIRSALGRLKRRLRS